MSESDSSDIKTAGEMRNALASLLTILIDGLLPSSSINLIMRGDTPLFLDRSFTFHSLFFIHVLRLAASRVP